MILSLKAFVVAPAVVPLVYAALFMAASGTGAFPVFGFLFAFMPAAAFSYAVTLLCFLPSLWLLSRFVRLTAPVTCVTGTILGALVWVPVSVQAWKESGPDSGPPIHPWFDSFIAWLTDPLTLLFPLGGLITAAFYWTLARPRATPDAARGGATTTRFWAAAALAPPIVPLVFAGAYNILHPVAVPLVYFVMTATAAVLFSYTVTLLLFMPVICLLSRITRVTAPLTLLAGALLGAVAYRLITLEGSASTQPAKHSLLDLLLPAWAGQMVWAFPLVGLITAALFWIFAYGFAWRSEQRSA
jgi:hypothetical protein